MTRTNGEPGLKHFKLLVAAEIIAVFLLNINHQSEQEVYAFFVRLAEGIINYGAYTGGTSGGSPVFYPLWGYAGLILLAGRSAFVILLIQGVLCFLGIMAFYNAYSIRSRTWHLLAIFPFVAVCSVKWPNAITASLLLFYLSAFRRLLDGHYRRAFLYGALSAGLGVVVRPEIWIWPVATLATMFFPIQNEYRKRIAAFAAVVICSQLLFISPWSYRAYMHYGKWLLTTTHGGHVAYISLGQDPSNPWGIKPLDSVGMEYAQSLGIGSSYLPEGDEAMRKRFNELIKENPSAYLRKMIVNLRSLVTHGIYAGQFFTLAMDEDEYWRVWEKKEKEGMLSALSALPLKSSASLLFHFGLDAVYRAGWILLLGFAAAGSVRMLVKRERFNPLAALTISLTAFMIALGMLMQYQPRHVNVVWLPLFGALLAFLPPFRIKGGS